jgi:hypothetical protein
MIWRCVCGRPNMEQQSRCVDCDRPRPSGDDPVGEEGEIREGPIEIVDSPEDPVSSSWARWQQRSPPAPGFVARAIRRVIFHYRRVLKPFIPGLVLLVVPIQLGYLEIAKAVGEGRAASGATMALTAALMALVTLTSYYLIILTAFSVRDEELDLAPFYTRLPWATLAILWLATMLYGLAIFLGFLLIIVPGLAALALLCLVQPMIVLDNATVGEALRVSPRMVIGRGGPQVLQVLAIILVVELGLTVAGYIVLMPLSVVVLRTAWPQFVFVCEIVIGGLLFPFHAVVLTILYDELVGIPRPEASA